MFWRRQQRRGDIFDLDSALLQGERLPRDIRIEYMAPRDSVSVRTAQSDFDYIDGEWLDVRTTPNAQRILPETVLSIRNAVVNARGAIRLSDGTRIKSSFFNTRPADWDQEDLREPEHMSGEWSSIIQGAMGFGHWLIHRVSRLMTAHDFGPDVPLLLNELPHGGDEFIRRSGYDPSTVRRLPRHFRKTWSIDRVLLPSYAGINAGRVADATRFHRDIARLTAGIELRNDTTTFPENIYLARRASTSSRPGLANGDEVEALFVGRGFVAIDPGALPFEEQVRLVRSARVIAGEGGSFAQNAMFARAGLGVIVVNASSGPAQQPYRPGNKTYARMVTDAFECNYRRINASNGPRFPGWSADIDMVARGLDSMPLIA